jgi:NAD(P)-dependent dehydrogenase (short-subunit alcohol dehydrogenase family)
MQDKPVALVTGANKRIGRQISKSVGADARALRLDVTNQRSVAAPAERIRNGTGVTSTSRRGVSHVGKPGSSLEGVVQSSRLSVVSPDEVRAVSIAGSSARARPTTTRARWWRPRPHYS